MKGMLFLLLPLACAAAAGAFSGDSVDIYAQRSDAISDIYAARSLRRGGPEGMAHCRLADFQLAVLSPDELRWARYGLLALHGHTWPPDSRPGSYYGGQPWYTPREDPLPLSPASRHNLELIDLYLEGGPGGDGRTPSREAMTGFWHASPVVGSGYSAMYLLHPDGRFVYRPSQMDGRLRLRELSGKWWLEDGCLMAAVDSLLYAVGGEVAEPYGSWGSDWVIEGATTEPVALAEWACGAAVADTLRFPLGGYTEDDDALGFEDAEIPRVRIGSTDYWKKRDPRVMPEGR
jgi:hypothetical protein